jgi:BAG domain
MTTRQVCLSIHDGVFLPERCLSVSAYGICNKSTIAIIGGGDHSNHPQRNTEQAVISQIQSEIDKVRSTLIPSLNKLLDVIAMPHRADDHPPTDAIEQEHSRLGELLLQSLLRLDAITAEGEWEQARKERKAGVREVQSLLDRLDSAWKARA